MNAQTQQHTPGRFAVVETRRSRVRFDVVCRGKSYCRCHFRSDAEQIAKALNAHKHSEPPVVVVDDAMVDRAMAEYSPLMAVMQGVRRTLEEEIWARRAILRGTLVAALAKATGAQS